jgi:hypothetical protein
MAPTYRAWAMLRSQDVADLGSKHFFQRRIARRSIGIEHDRLSVLKSEVEGNYSSESGIRA